MNKPDFEPEIAEQDSYGNTTTKNQGGVILCKICLHIGENGVCESHVKCPGVSKNKQ